MPYAAMFSNPAYYLTVDAQVTPQNLMQKLESLGMQVNMQALRDDNLEQTLTDEGPYTIFAPRRNRLQMQDRFLRTALAAEITIRMHVVEGSYTKRDLRNNQILRALNGELLRVNIYTVDNDQVYTLNGVPVQTFDNVASNGVVHTLQFTITPTLGSASEILNLPVVGAQMFLQAAQASGLVDELNAAARTLLVPGDDVLTEDVLNGLRANPTQLERMVKNHILPNNVLYTEGMSSAGRSTLLDGEMLVFHRQFFGTVIDVNGARIMKEDIPTSNGVVHVINQIYIPRAVGTTMPGIG